MNEGEKNREEDESRWKEEQGRGDEKEEEDKKEEEEVARKYLFDSSASVAATSCVLAPYRNICQETVNYVCGNFTMPETTL